MMGSISSIPCAAVPPSMGTGGASAETMASFTDPFCGNGDNGGGVDVESAPGVVGREDVRGVGPGPGVRFGISSIRVIELFDCG